MRDRSKGLVLAASAPLAWASNVVASRVLVSGGVDPYTLTAVRWGLAALLMTLYTLATGRRLVLTTSITVLGLLGITLFNNMLYLSVRYAPAALVGLVFGLLPIVTMLLARAAGLEPLDSWTLAAAFIGFIGVALLEAGSLSGGPKGEALGIAIALLSVVVWALYTLLSKKLMKGLDPLEALASSTVASTPFNIASALILGAPQASLNQLASTSLNLTLLLYVTLVPGFLAYLAWFHAVKILGAGITSLFVDLLPPSTLLLAVLLLGERLHGLQVLGAALVLLSLALAARRQLQLAAATHAILEQEGSR